MGTVLLLALTVAALAAAAAARAPGDHLEGHETVDVPSVPAGELRVNRPFEAGGGGGAVLPPLPIAADAPAAAEAAAWAVRELQKLSDSGVYETLRLRAVLGAATQVRRLCFLRARARLPPSPSPPQSGVYHDNVFLNVSLATPHFKSGAAAEVYVGADAGAAGAAAAGSRALLLLLLLLLLRPPRPAAPATPPPPRTDQASLFFSASLSQVPHHRHGAARERRTILCH